ncbi:MAG TPA: MlaD family protein [Mycobacteriales bacterium]|nr:MlaD family protein [Mycobacteriales bacterium]HVX69546.1 MlaD family protein [Mycobacteriales bacterium]HWA65593.1 MlaD family protein [Mycobacteriales bacterium]
MRRFGELFADLVRRFGAGVVALVAVVALVIVIVVVSVTTGGGKTYKLTAYFTKTVGLYTGNDVRIMGVKVGHIDSITPVGTEVKVVMSYDGDDRVPLHAKAVVIEPSIVSDRYVQITPGYVSGPTLPNNAVLGCPPNGTAVSDTTNPATCAEQTAVPLELDQIFGNLNQLDSALGPNGANKNGALAQLIKIGAENLKGNGQAFNAAFKQFSTLISTLAGSRGDLFDTVSSLQKFTTTLANDNGGVVALNKNLAQVGSQLAGERKDLGAALANLATALTSVETFVADNRAGLKTDIHSLAKVTDVLTQEKTAITQLTDLTPLALSNLSLAYDPATKTLDTNAALTEPLLKTGPSGALCQLLGTLGLDTLVGDAVGCSANKPVISTSSLHHQTPTLAELLTGGAT